MGVGWWAKIYLACLGVAVLVLSFYPPEDTYVYDIYPTREVHTVEKVVETVCLDEVPICEDVEGSAAPVTYDFTINDVANLTESYIGPVSNRISVIENAANYNKAEIEALSNRINRAENVRYDMDKKIILAICAFLLLIGIILIVSAIRSKKENEEDVGDLICYLEQEEEITDECE